MVKVTEVDSYTEDFSDNETKAIAKIFSRFVDYLVSETRRDFIRASPSLFRSGTKDNAVLTMELVVKEKSGKWLVPNKAVCKANFEVDIRNGIGKAQVVITVLDPTLRELITLYVNNNKATWQKYFKTADIDVKIKR